LEHIILLTHLETDQQPVRALLFRDGKGGTDASCPVGKGFIRIVEAIEWLRKDFDQSLRIDKIAEELGMSISSFNHHFRALTALQSPCRRP